MNRKRPTQIEFSRRAFILEPRYYFYGWSASPVIQGQRDLVLALMRAQKFLPKGYRFKIWDCQRSRATQIAMLNSFKKRLKKLYPDLSSAERTKLLHQFGARPLKRVTRPDTHRNGGAVDLTIVGRDGQELWMGTDHDDLTDRAATNYFEANSPRSPLDQEARKNHRLLIRVLTKAGLHNYRREWWHWYCLAKQ